MDVSGCQILTSKVGPRTKRVKPSEPYVEIKEMEAQSHLIVMDYNVVDSKYAVCCIYATEECKGLTKLTITSLWPNCRSLHI